MSIVSLTTDFGTRDGNVGVMKGVIWGIDPTIQIADISHEINPQDVYAASLVLDRQVWYFPPGTVHVVVVDPGVGTARRPIAAKLGVHYFVAPDNGVLSSLYERAEKNVWEIKTVHTDNPKYWLPEISNVFHGRDIFSPVGAYLAAGVPLEELGSVITDPMRFTIPQPQRTEEKVVGEVINIDNFGNVATNIRVEHIAGMGDVKVTIAGRTIEGLVKAFGEGELGEMVALFDSFGYLSVAVVNGSASSGLHSKVGDPVEVVSL
ncbi:MAG: SAM-dependent chlorinase/fluorinase [Anaerolineales bacterium]|nr:SAM-dependent chlorinase/fluorinase [Anaerolineales bacterium]